MLQEMLLNKFAAEKWFGMGSTILHAWTCKRTRMGFQTRMLREFYGFIPLEINALLL